MFKLIEIDLILPLANLSCELGLKIITIYRFIGGQASGTPNDHIINCRPDGFYLVIYVAPIRINVEQR